jgi:nucleoside-diphosphate-sugar epimerase
MKAFITGASGFIGTHLAEELLRRKWQVSVLVHERDLPQPQRFQIIRGDIKEDGTLREMFQGTDVLFHLAAVLGAARIDKNEFFKINAEGTENVLKAAREARIKRIIHFSSAGVLGSVKENRAVEEDHPPSPQDVYDRTKLEGERIALRYAQEGSDLVVVRPGWVYGPGDRRTFKLIKAVATRRFILPTRGTARQTPVYINDLIQGVLLAAEKARAGEVYHLAGSEVLPVREIVSLIARAAGVRFSSFPFPVLPLKTAAFVLEKTFVLMKKEAPLTRGKLAFFIHPKPLSIRKAVAELGFSPRTDLKRGMSQTVSWYRKNGWLGSYSYRR